MNWLDYGYLPTLCPAPILILKRNPEKVYIQKGKTGKKVRPDREGQRIRSAVTNANSQQTRNGPHRIYITALTTHI